jgi:hypothetical protein
MYCHNKGKKPVMINANNKSVPIYLKTVQYIANLVMTTCQSEHVVLLLMTYIKQLYRSKQLRQVALIFSSGMCCVTSGRQYISY